MKRGLIIGGVVLVFWGPFMVMIATAFATTHQFWAESVKFRFTFKHIIDVIVSPDFHLLRYIFNSCIVAGASALLCVSLGLGAAYSLTRTRFAYVGMVLSAIIIVSMFPQISIVGKLYQFFASIGLINTLAGLVLAHSAWALPLSIWILTAYYRSVPDEIFQSARIDGAGVLQSFFLVFIPLGRPAIFSTMIVVFILSFNEFLFTLMLTTDYHARTLPVGIALFQGLHGETPWGSIMAAALIATIPVAALVIYFQRSIISGITAGSDR